MGKLSNGFCLALVLAIALLSTSLANAKEQVVVFFPVPPDKEKLVEDLLGRGAVEKEDLLEGKIRVKTDVRIAEVALMPDRPSQLLVLNEAYEWCGTEGCSLYIWERQGEGWRLLDELSTQNNGALRVQGWTDHGYFRLVERHSMLVNDDNWGRKKVFNRPIIYRWTGTHYRSDTSE